MQLALIIPISGEQLPPGLLPSPQPPWVPGGPGAGQLPGPGSGQLPTFPGPGAGQLPNIPTRDELRAAIRAKLEELAAGMNPPSRDEIRAKAEQIAEAIREKLSTILPPPCVSPH